MTNPGIVFERELAKDLRGLGYSVVRAAASKGRLAHWDADLIASKITPGNKYEIGIAIIQCKRSKR